MTTLSMPRQPFGVLESPRLAHLSSSKNRQNGAITKSSPLSGKAKMALSNSILSSSPKLSMKRPLAPFTFADDNDTENVKPDMFLSSSKRAKTDPSLTTLKPNNESSASPSSFNFTFAAPKASTSMLPPSIIPSRLQTPTRGITKNKSSPRTPRTAPAGRSPKSKRDRRRMSAHTPIIRVDPPASDCTGLPFSIGAALSGSLAPPTSAAAAPLPKPAPVEDPMPQSWFFSIYEDTAQEEAENLMEHSTLTLDLSSDDESSIKAGADHGKENVAPADYLPSPSNSSSPISRRTRSAVKSAADMDTDEAPRSPLGSLDAAEFIPEGLEKDSIIYVPVTDDKPASVHVKLAAPIVAPQITAVVEEQKEPNNDILIWEDDSASSPAPSTGGKRKRSACDSDEC